MNALDRRDFLTLAFGGAAAVALSPAASLAALARRREKLNVLFIAVDDLRPELGCYGHPMVRSPHIDKLAASGTLFTRAYCQQAVCAPSRASLLTGLRPDSTKIYDLRHPVSQYLPDVLTLPQHFRKSGYTTISLGKIYHHHSDDKPGWTERPATWKGMYASRDTEAQRRRRFAEGRQKGYTGSRLYNFAAGPSTECLDVPDNAYDDGVIADKAVEAIRKHKAGPFFLAAGFKKPHLPFTAPKKYWDRYDRARIRLPNAAEPRNAPRMALTNWGELRAYSDIPATGDLDEAHTRRLIHGYHACVSFVDAQIGRILAELDRLDLRRKTVVILWGDHGWKLGEYGDWCKHTNFELDTHVPMLLSVPGRKAGRRCVALTEYVDIYPTLAELCGLKVPGHCEGTSMVPLLADPDREWKTAAFSQYPRRGAMGYSLRTPRWRYTEWIERRTKRVVARELYDHAKGAFAHANVVDQPEHAELVRELAGMMKAGWRAARPKT